MQFLSTDRGPWAEGRVLTEPALHAAPNKLSIWPVLARHSVKYEKRLLSVSREPTSIVFDGICKNFFSLQTLFGLVFSTE